MANALSRGLGRAESSMHVTTPRFETSTTRRRKYMTQQYIASRCVWYNVIAGTKYAGDLTRGSLYNACDSVACDAGSAIHGRGRGAGDAEYKAGYMDGRMQKVEPRGHSSKSQQDVLIGAQAAAAAVLPNLLLRHPSLDTRPPSRVIAPASCIPVAMSSHDESEDEELKYAIALSLQQPARTEEQKDEEQDAAPGPTRSDGRDSSSFTLLSLNRKRMESERLARLAAKRTRTVDEDDDDVQEIPAPKKGRPSLTNRRNDHVPIPYPNGVVKRTWTRGYDRSDDVIQIDEILQKDKLLLAFFSSFQWNEPWLLRKINLSQTKVLLAAFAANDAQV
ncbi:hypothetical protein E4U43_003741, partial [Claviceps pusilla]